MIQTTVVKQVSTVCSENYIRRYEHNFTRFTGRHIHFLVVKIKSQYKKKPQKQKEKNFTRKKRVRLSKVIEVYDTLKYFMTSALRDMGDI